jgi:glycosyltransferase involved in cell wall biosynthesis
MLKKICVVIPLHNEANNLAKLVMRLDQVTSKLPAYRWEYIFVNDGSTDSSLAVLKDLAAQQEKIRALDLSRNFGKEIALTAGVHEALHADAVICIDADLQHPPELIPDLIRNWLNGSEIVVTVRLSTDKETLLRKLGSHLFYFLINKFSETTMVPKTTDFRLYDKKVIAAFRLVTERNRMFRGLMDWMGFKKTYIEFRADARLSGSANYSFKKLWQLAISSITSFSLVPLRITGYLGLSITSVSGLILLWMLITFLLYEKWPYTTLALVVITNTFLIGIVLISIGLVALYIGTIHTEVINRPLYIVREKINFREE